MPGAHLYVAGPNLFDPAITQPVLTHEAYFGLGLSPDGDVWPEISIYQLHEDEEKKYHRCGGRFRTPMVGGGASDKLYSAMRDLVELMEIDARRTHEGLQGHLDLWPPLPVHRYAERHMDDGRGYFGVEIAKGGVVRIRMRPHEHKDVVTFNRDVTITIPPHTPYRFCYRYMEKLWKAIKADNKKLGSFGGFHAY